MRPEAATSCMPLDREAALKVRGQVHVTLSMHSLQQAKVHSSRCLPRDTFTLSFCSCRSELNVHQYCSFLLLYVDDVAKAK
jgi:hypothetical protein